MSPFADALRTLRFRRGLRQQELADLVGCDRSYLSALENDLKHAASDTLVRELSSALELPDGEASALATARERSRRTYVVPADTPMQGYDLVYELFDRLEGLSELQIQAMRAVLQMGDRSKASGVEGRIRRRPTQPSAKESAV